MQQFTWTVLDDWVVAEADTIVVLSPGQFDDGLGMVDQLLVELTIDQLHGHNMTADLSVEHSADGIHWLGKNKKPEIEGAKIEAPGKNYLPFVFEDGIYPTLGYVRVRITLHQKSPAPVYPFKGYVQLVITGNDYNEAGFRHAIDMAHAHALDDAESELGDKICWKKFGPNSWLPAQVSSMATPADLKYIEWVPAHHAYRVKPPYTICQGSDQLLTVIKGTAIVHHDSEDAATNSTEQSH